VASAACGSYDAATAHGLYGESVCTGVQEFCNIGVEDVEADGGVDVAVEGCCELAV
jgi:hypothetical protein